MLLPGTFGKSCWYTRVTLAFFDFGGSASTLPNGSVARSSEQRMRFMERLSFDWRMRIRLLPVSGGAIYRNRRDQGAPRPTARASARPVITTSTAAASCYLVGPFPPQSLPLFEPPRLPVQECTRSPIDPQ